jgi:integrase
MRVEELTGLQWKFIDLREGHRTISIRNAISSIERQEHALERVRKGLYKTKNPTSVRTIPIFDFYYELLIDYKESFMYEYGLNKKQIEECFVFPNLKWNDPYKYMRGDKILNELKKVVAELNLPKTDLQMFRHSCATWLFSVKIPITVISKVLRHANVNETMKILRKYRPNLEIGKVENGWVHLKNKDDKDYKDKSYTDRELNVIE